MVKGGSCGRADEEDQSVCRRLCRGWAVDAKEPHARHNGANEIYVEDGQDVHEVKHHGRSQEGETSECLKATMVQGNTGDGLV